MSWIGQRSPEQVEFQTAVTHLSVAVVLASAAMSLCKIEAERTLGLLGREQLQCPRLLTQMSVALTVARMTEGAGGIDCFLSP
jgi:hypothetical protein